MKDSKNLKNQNNKMSEQTPSPAVSNRTHTEMNASNKNANNNQNNSNNSGASNSVKKQNNK